MNMSTGRLRHGSPGHLQQDHKPSCGHADVGRTGPSGRFTFMLETTLEIRHSALVSPEGHRQGICPDDPHLMPRVIAPLSAVCPIANPALESWLAQRRCDLGAALTRYPMKGMYRVCASSPPPEVGLADPTRLVLRNTEPGESLGPSIASCDILRCA